MRKKNMNRAVKSLSLVLALSMGFGLASGMTTLTAEAAAKNGVVRKGSTTVYSSKKGTSAFIGEGRRDLDLLINGKNITKNVKWTSSKKSIATVDKNGKVTAKSNGSAVISATYKNKKYYALVKVYTRAESVSVEDNNGITVTELSLVEGESKNLNVRYKLSDAVLNANGVSSTYNSYVSQSNPEVAALSKVSGSSRDFTVTAIKEGTTEVEVVANQTGAAKVKSDSKFVTAKIRVVVTPKEAKAEAKQAGVKKIVVKGSNLSAQKTAYTVKRGNVTLSVGNVVLNSSQTEAVLLMDATLIAGDYTVETAGKILTFTAEAERIAKIDVPNRYLVLNGDSNAAGGTVEYRVTNQFDEDITKAVSGITATLTQGRGVVNPNAGTIAVTDIPAGLPLKSKVNITLIKIDGANVVNGSYELELSEKARASSVVVKGVYNNETKQPYTIEANKAVENAKARLLISVKDQYGRSLKSTEGVNITVNPGLTGIGVENKVYNELLTVDGTDYVAVGMTGLDKVKQGTATVTFISIMGVSGNNVSTTTINVGSTKQVSAFSVTAPSEVYAGETTYFSFTATNSSGQSITDFATLSSETYGVKLPAAFSWENTADGTAKLKYDAKKDTLVNGFAWNAAIPSITSSGVFTVAATLQPTVISFKVNAPAVPAGIKSFSVDGVLAGVTTENVLGKVKIIDNRGRELSDLSAMGDYYLGFKKNATTSHFTLNAPAGAVNGTVDNTVTLIKLSELAGKTLTFTAAGAAVDNYVTEAYTVAIYKGKEGNNAVAGSETGFNLTIADLKKLSGFALSIPEFAYGAADNAGYNNVKVIVTGRAANGSSVRVTDAQFEIRDTAGIADNANKTLTPNLVAARLAKEGNITDTVTAVVNNGAGEMVSKNIVISQEAPVAVKVEANSGELAAAALMANPKNTVLSALAIYDRYTVEANNVLPSSDAVKKSLMGIRLVSSSSSDITTNWNNTTNIEIKGAKAGDIITLQITFDKGVNGTFNFKLK